MRSESTPQALQRYFDQMIDMLQEHGQRDINQEPVAEPLPSLLAQCEDVCSKFEGPRPLRSIHHFACSGGTLISKSLFTLPNTVVLSEIDPLSPLVLRPQRDPFAPTDLILALRKSLRPIDDEAISAVFRAAVSASKVQLERRGLHLIIRDHAHSQFCTAQDFKNRPTLHEMLSEEFTLRSVLTMRHPLDSFLSLLSNNWAHFEPLSLDSYASRYLAFLDRYQGVPIVFYEDFVADPNAVLRGICEHLELRFSPLATDLIELVHLSGDSGRSDTRRIHARPRRDVPEEIAIQRTNSPSYRLLCEKFNYDP